MSQDNNQNDRDPQDGQDQDQSQGQRDDWQGQRQGAQNSDVPRIQRQSSAPELDDTDEMDDDDDRDDDDRGPGSPNRRHNIG